MRHLSFVPTEVLRTLVGSSAEEVDQLERDLGLAIPAALREYLLTMGESPPNSEYHHHGTREMKYMQDWLGDWVRRYRAEGIPLPGMDNAIPFLQFQDTFFYVLAGTYRDDPPAYAFDINDTPTIRLLHDRFTDFVVKQWGHKGQPR